MTGTPAAPGPLSAEGYTLLACCGSGCEAHPRRGDVEESVRDIVRRSSHGVLVMSSGCVLGTLLCRTCGPGSGRVHGTVALVQPCTAERKPTGPAVPVGPLSSVDHLIALLRWLRGVELTAATLPRQLHPALAPLHAASGN